jgi:hypothetical protein
MKGGHELGDVNSTPQLAPNNAHCCAIFLLTLPFVTQCFPPSLQDRLSVADETASAIHSATVTEWTFIRISLSAFTRLAHRSLSLG